MPVNRDKGLRLRPAAGMHVEWVGEEAVVLDTGSGRVHYLNPPAALVFALIADVGYERALRQVRESFSGTPNLDEEVQQLIHELRDKGLLTVVEALGP